MLPVVDYRTIAPTCCAVGGIVFLILSFFSCVSLLKWGLVVMVCVSLFMAVISSC